MDNKEKEYYENIIKNLKEIRIELKNLCDRLDDDNDEKRRS